MSVSVFSAAKTLCSITNWTITNLQLQKMLYIAHLLYFARTGIPLINEQFEAWDYGPVVPKLYQRLKMYGNKPVSDVFYGDNIIIEPEALGVLKEIGNALKDVDASKLVALTHSPNGAWYEVYKPGVRGIKIPDHLIQKEAAALFSSAPAQKA